MLLLGACARHYFLFYMCKIGVKSSPICRCGFDNETKTHFFYIVCNVQWQGLPYSQKADLSIFGCCSLSNDEDVKIFTRVQQYIKKFKHFVLFV